MTKRSGLLACLCLSLLLALPVAGTAATGKKPKNIIFFIGYGIGGTASVYLAEAYLGAKDSPKTPSIVPLYQHTMGEVGLTTTYSWESPITESAGASTAMATGIKSKQIAIGVDHEGEPLESILETAHKAGLRTGLVTDVSIDHATSSGYCAKNANRRASYEIAMDMPKSGVNLLMGGGFLDPEGKKAKNPGKSIYDNFRDHGYKVVNTAEGFHKLNNKDDKVVWMHPEQHDGKALRYAIDADDDYIHLPEMTEKAIELMENPNGFFLMIEGGKVDWAGHANDTGAYLHDILLLDKAIKIALDYAAKKGDTLVVVSQDHGCGGLTMGSRGVGYDGWYERIDWQKHSYVVAQEKIREFKKQNPNATFEDILPFLKENWNLIPASKKFLDRYAELEKQGVKWQQASAIYKEAQNMLLPHEEKELREAFAATMKKPAATLDQYMMDAGIYDPFVMTANSIIAAHAGLQWTTWGHTGDPAITTATGPGQSMFNGYYDNTDLYFKMMELLDLEVPARNKEGYNKHNHSMK